MSRALTKVRSQLRGFAQTCQQRSYHLALRRITACGASRRGGHESDPVGETQRSRSVPLPQGRSFFFAPRIPPKSRVGKPACSPISIASNLAHRPFPSRNGWIRINSPCTTANAAACMSIASNLQGVYSPNGPRGEIEHQVTKALGRLAQHIGVGHLHVLKECRSGGATLNEVIAAVLAQAPQFEAVGVHVEHMERTHMEEGQRLSFASDAVAQRCGRSDRF
jgi:hypothetical protein